MNDPDHRPPNDILYIDLNSCFASIEQQCRPMLRGRPVAITNRLVPNSCIITASYEAKACGVKVGMRAREASTICPGIVFAESEPSKYIFVHEKLKRIMRDYSPNVVMKSIDEGVIDLKDAPRRVYERNRFELGRELKQRLKDEIGCYMRCNVGIASNRFLAKLAGELHKPDGLDEITTENQRKIFATLKLTDLPGINVRMEARLNAVGIFTPLQFLDADEATLVKLVCKSIEGHKWYRRLRGFEVDDVMYGIKSIGREYVLDSRNLSHEETEIRLVHLAEDVGYRLRSKELYARGVYVWTYDFVNGHKHRQTILHEAIHTDQDIARVARQLFKELDVPVFIIGITLYKLQPHADTQLSLEQKEKDRAAAVCNAEDAINLRFGMRKIHCADTIGTEQIKCKVPFGSTRFLDHSIS
jgi:DNA polymerase-4